MFESLKVDRKSVSSAVIEHIKQLIHEEKLTPGDKLPSEREMAGQIQVSRNTVREAYKMLEAEGYLIIKHGNGVFVADQESQIRKLTASLFVKEDQVRDLLSIRKVLEVEAVKWAAQRGTPQDYRYLHNVLDDMKTLIKDRNYEELKSLDQDFHIHIAQMSGNRIMLRIMLNLVDMINEMQNESLLIPGRAKQSLDEHLQILKAMEEKDIQKAGQYMQEHLTSIEQSLSLKEK
ncbi:FadR/GntR family transcriptional regulator [Ammoniphilus sp. YIM 78166]|uniref:FadR/GntR family transcriptional regulator n=1 Tax=Ammoniphilus sp. YIM 78166 TaxID=1644106 RepID=UPI00106FFEE7|nr:FadR/GntR family transcriptional regulator [Ammoniphilus sp. YIM 78166]